MSTISDALGGGSGVTDQTLSNASLGDQLMGGTGDFGTGASSDAFASAGNNFPSFNTLANLFSGGQGGNPSIASAAPGTAAAAELPSGGAQGDPVAAQGGTQSGVSPDQGQGSQQNQPQRQASLQEQPDQRPKTQVDELRGLLDQLIGKRGPTGFVPQPPHTPTVPGALNALFGSQQGGNITVRPKARPVPPYEPGDAGAPPAPETTQGGPEGDATPPAAPAPVVSDTPGPATTQPPQVAQPAPDGPQQADPRQMSRIMQDIAGISHGNPMALFDLASLLYGVGAPLAALHSQRPHGGFAPVGAPLQRGFRPLWGGFSQAPSQEEWDDQERARGESDALGRTDKNGQPSPTGAFDRNGAFVAEPDKTPVSNQIPGVTPKMVDDYWRQGAQKRGMDPDIASKVVGAESGYGQNNINRRDVNGYPDYGPPQLNMAPGALGDQFLKQTGINPRDFAQGDNWKKMSDFALDHIAKEGWTDLYPGTSKKLGLSRWSGINRPTPPVSIRPLGTDPRTSFLTGAQG